MTPAVNPPAGSILRAGVTPAFGGDTMWTNLAAAYRGLPAAMRAFVDQLRAEHRYGGPDKPAPDSPYAKRILDNPMVSIHPVVRVHPATGGRVLYVNPGFTSHVVIGDRPVGVDGRQSELVAGEPFTAKRIVVTS
ncbi:TauD/TfdA dioxygenase family protein [Micromonospora sp. LOL_024]|uniref:TauD/TfdA dioxygenase family protein n=1 Tax=Micromonospora sp. LOL_024 TaxID=3345412 RepID=UPI003A8428EB